MASPTVVPAAPAAAPAAPAAPSSPAPAAPAAPTPAAPVSAPESTSTSTNPPVDGTPSSPATPAAPTSDAGTPAPVASAPAEPKASDFDDPGAFLTAHSRWEKEKAEFDEKNPVKPEGDKPAETPKPEDPAAPEAEAKADADDAPVLTPQEFDKLISDNPALKAAYEADPKAKGELMKMAREYAKVKPIAEMFPTKQSAEFAKKTSVEYVSLRGKFEAAAEDPSMIGDAFESFVDQFKIVGADGKVMVDDKGQPVLADDFNLLATHMNKLYKDGSIAELEERLAANNYASEEAREKDEQKLLAWRFISEESEEAPSKPDYSHLPEEARKAAEAKDARIKELEEQLNGKEGKQDSKTKAEARQKWNQEFGTEHARELVTMTDSLVSDMRKEGANIPQWSLNLKVPGSNVPVIYQNILNAFKESIQADAYTLSRAKALERMAPTPENLKERLNFFSDLAKQNLRSIVKKQIREINAGMVPEAPASTPEPNPSIEPAAGGGPVAPKALTMEAARDLAKQQLAKEVKGWDEMEPSEKNGHILTRIGVLMRR